MKKKLRFFPYGIGTVLCYILLSPIVIILLFIVFSGIALFFMEGGPLMAVLFILIGLLCCGAYALFFLYFIALGMMFSCSLIEIDSEGISRGFFRKESYRWDEVTQFGVTLLEPPERGVMGFAAMAKSDPETRSIYLVFGLPGEPPAVEWDISRFGAYEFWSHSERPDRYLGFVDDIFAALQKKSRSKERDEVYDCFFPKRFMAMQFTTERFLLINDCLKKAGFDPMAVHGGSGDGDAQL